MDQSQAQYMPGDMAVMVLRFLASMGCEESVMKMVEELPFIKFYVPPQPQGMSRTEYIRLLSGPGLTPGLKDILNDYARAKAIVAETLQRQNPSRSPAQSCDSLVTQLKNLVEGWRQSALEAFVSTSTPQVTVAVAMSEASVNTDPLELEQLEESLPVRDTSNVETQTEEEMEFSEGEEYDGQSQVQQFNAHGPMPLLFHNTLVQDTAFPEKVAEVATRYLQQTGSVVDAVEKATSQLADSEIDRFLNELLADESVGTLTLHGPSSLSYPIDESLSSMFDDASSLIKKDKAASSQVERNGMKTQGTDDLIATTSSANVDLALEETSTTEQQQQLQLQPTKKVVQPKAPLVVVPKPPPKFVSVEEPVVHNVNPPTGRPYSIHQNNTVRVVSEWEKLKRRSIEPKILPPTRCNLVVSTAQNKQQQRPSRKTKHEPQKKPVSVTEPPIILTVTLPPSDEPESEYILPHPPTSTTTPNVDKSQGFLQLVSNTRITQNTQNTKHSESLPARQFDNNRVQEGTSVAQERESVRLSSTPLNKRKARLSTPVKLTPEKARTTEFYIVHHDSKESRKASPATKSQPHPLLPPPPLATTTYSCEPNSPIIIPGFKLVGSPVKLMSLSPVKPISTCKDQDKDNNSFATANASFVSLLYEKPVETPAPVEIMFHTEVTPALNTVPSTNEEEASPDNKLSPSPRLQRLISSAQKLRAISTQHNLNRKSWSTPRKNRSHVRNLFISTPPSSKSKPAGVNQESSPPSLRNGAIRSSNRKRKADDEDEAAMVCLEPRSTKPTSFSLITPVKNADRNEISPIRSPMVPPTPRIVISEVETDSNSNSNMGGFRPIEEIFGIGSNSNTPFMLGPPPTPGKTIQWDQRSHGLSLTVSSAGVQSSTRHQPGHVLLSSPLNLTSPLKLYPNTNTVPAVLNKSPILLKNKQVQPPVSSENGPSPPLRSTKFARIQLPSNQIKVKRHPTFSSFNVNGQKVCIGMSEEHPLVQLPIPNPTQRSTILRTDTSPSTLKPGLTTMNPSSLGNPNPATRKSTPNLNTGSPIPNTTNPTIPASTPVTRGPKDTPTPGGNGNTGASAPTTAITSKSKETTPVSASAKDANRSFSNLLQKYDLNKLLQNLAHRHSQS